MVELQAQSWHRTPKNETLRNLDLRLNEDFIKKATNPFKSIRGV